MSAVSRRRRQPSELSWRQIVFELAVITIGLLAGGVTLVWGIG